MTKIEELTIKAIEIANDWCEYNGETYYASLNYEESVRRGKPVFDLAYCATKAFNNIFLKQRVWSKKFTPSKMGYSKW
jgi:hypothetical protein